MEAHDNDNDNDKNLGGPAETSHLNLPLVSATLPYLPKLVKLTESSNFENHRLYLNYHHPCQCHTILLRTICHQHADNQESHDDNHVSHDDHQNNHDGHQQNHDDDHQNHHDHARL